jgi:intracellular multiplication protein IcmQ
MSNDKEQREKLLKVVSDAVRQDKELREKYQIGDKFRFIRDRLIALLSQVEESLSSLQKKAEKKSDELLADEMLIYVYLFNTQGLIFQTWQKMLNPSVFYEYSVNRPIYTEKAFVDSFIRSKASLVQHGYLTIAIKKQDIIKDATTEGVKDAIGNPIVKVKEGSLHVEKLVSFTHNGHEYVLNEVGAIVKKQAKD